MYRCFAPDPRALAGLVVVTVTLAGAAVAPAFAQVQRNFPATALRGTIAFGQPPEIVLNGTETRLSPGARVRGPDNLLQMTGALVGAKLVVNYTLDTLSQVHDVWLLRPQEAAVRPWPRTLAEAEKWSFDPAAQTWTRP